MAHSKQPATSGPSASSGPGAQANSQTALQRVKGHCNDLLLRGALKIPNCFIIPQPPPPREREKASQVSPVRTQAAVPHGPTQALISPGSAREQDPGAGSVSQPGGSRHSGLSSQLEQVLTAPAIPALYTQKPHTVCVRKVATLQGQPRGGPGPSTGNGGLVSRMLARNVAGTGSEQPSEEAGARKGPAARDPGLPARQACQHSGARTKPARPPDGQDHGQGGAGRL